MICRSKFNQELCDDIHGLEANLYSCLLPNLYNNIFTLINLHNNQCLVYIPATVFGDLFLRPPPQSAVNDGRSKASRRQLVRSEEMKRAGFVYHFLSNEYDE